VQADGIRNLRTLSCKIHDYITKGTYLEIDGVVFVKCVIPSFDYLKLTKINPIAADDSFIIEVSNNGKDFSNSEKRFKYMTTD
jgi:hypothetical protein